MKKIMGFLVGIFVLTSFFMLLTCEVPSDPFDKNATKLTFFMKSSSGDVSDTAITDTVGNTDTIGVVVFLTENFDSTVLEVTFKDELEYHFAYRKQSQYLDTIYYIVKFPTAGDRHVNVTGYLKDDMDIEYSAIIHVVERPGQNHTPVLTVSGERTVEGGETVELSASAEDSDSGQTVTIEVVGLPDKATFTDSILKWTTTMADTGIDTVLFIATDNGKPAKSDTDTVVITISATPVNHSPKWDSESIELSGETDSVYSLELADRCTDSDEDKLSFTLLDDGPDGDKIVDDSVWTFTPAIGDTGDFTAVIVATDSEDATDTLTIKLKLTRSDNTPPEMRRVAPEDDSLTISATSFRVKITCVDKSGVEDVVCSMDGETFEVTTSEDSIYSATITDLKSGWNTIRFIATDKSPSANQETLYVVLNYDSEAPDNIAPTITLVSPSKDTTIGEGSIEVRVQCVDDSGVSLVTIGGVEASRGADDLFTATVEDLDGGKNTITIVAKDSAAASNTDSTSFDVVYDNDAKGPELTLVTPEKDSVVTNSTSYTVFIRCTDPSGVRSVSGKFGSSSFTGVRDTGKVWKVSVNGLAENEVNIVILMATDSSLHANKSFDTVYITSEIINGHTVTFNKNDAAATGAMEAQTMSSGVKTALSANAFTKAGWTFTGWATSATGEVEFADGADYTIDASDVKLYAVWSLSDNTPPSITLVSPSKDTTIGVDSCKISVWCTDESGVAQVKIGTVTAARETGAIFSATVKGLVSGANTITIVATDSAATPHTDSTQVKITYDSDVAGPAITKVTPANDSVATNSANYTFSLNCTDPSGVKSVTGAIGTTKFNGTRGSGSTWDIAVSGLAEGVYTKVVFTATDSSLRANATPLTLYIKHDPTIGDGEGPTIKQISGPASGSVVSNPLVTIIDSITDPSDVDSVYWTLNNGAAKQMTSVAGIIGQYSLTETLVREKFDTIVVTAVDKSTQRNRSTQTIVLNYIIAPSITDQPDSKEICSGGDATVSVTASGTAPLTYQWLESGIAISGATSPNYTASSLTTKKILRCVVSNGATVKATSAEATITVAPVVTVVVSPASAGACSGGSATFTAAATGGTTHTWQWFKGTAPNGAVVTGATAKTLTVNTTDVGSYYCVAKSSDGCSGTSNGATFTQNEDVTLKITAPATTICSGSSVTLTAVPTGGSSHTYAWSTGGTGATLRVTAAGTYSCIATSSGGCAGSAEYTLTANTTSVAPTIRVANNGPTSVCSGPVVIELTPGTGTLGTGAKWVWYNNSSPTANDGKTSITVYPTEATTKYTVKAVGGICGGEPESAPVIVTLKQEPIAAQVAGVPTSAICNGEQIRLTISAGSVGDGGHWEWREESKTGKNITPSTNPEILYVSPSITTTYWLGAVGGCSDKWTSVTIDVKVDPTAPTIDGVPPFAVCPGSGITLTRKGGDLGDAKNWVWRESLITGKILGTNLTSLTVYPKTTTTYVLVAEGGCNKVWAEAKVLIDGPVIVTQTTGPIVTPKAIDPNGTRIELDVDVTNGSGTYTYQWYHNGVAIDPWGNDGVFSGFTRYMGGYTDKSLSFAALATIFSGNFACEIKDATAGCTIWSEAVSVTITDN